MPGVRSEQEVLLWALAFPPWRSCLLRCGGHRTRGHRACRLRVLFSYLPDPSSWAPAPSGSAIASWGRGRGGVCVAG